MTVYNEVTNLEEMGLTIQSLLGAIYLQNHNILCMVVQTVRETLRDVPKDRSTNVKAHCRTTVPHADITATCMNRRLVGQEIPAAFSKRWSVFINA